MLQLVHKSRYQAGLSSFSKKGNVCASVCKKPDNTYLFFNIPDLCGWAFRALGVLGLGLAVFAAAPVRAAGGASVSVPEDMPGYYLPGDLRKLAVFDNPGTLAANFIERGAAQFAGVTAGGLSWSPTATNVYALILARKGVARTVGDQTITMEFRLPSDGASLGLHLHGKSEADPSHLVLISRSAGDRGLIRVYRTPTWPSSSIPATDLLAGAQARVPAFPADAWHRLVVTTQIDRATAETTLFIQLLAGDSETQLAKLEARDTGLALPEAGLVALRLFSPAGGRIEVRTLIGQPQP